MQLCNVIDLVKAVDDCLVAHGNIPLHYFVQNHVFHFVGTKVRRNFRPNGFNERRSIIWSEKVDPDPAAPFTSSNLLGAYIFQMFVRKVFTLGHANELASGVVHPTVIRASEATSTTTREVSHNGRATVLTHIVECSK